MMTAQAVVPVVETERTGDLLRSVLHDAPAPEALTLRPPHPRAVRRALIATGVRGALLTALVGWFLFPTGLLVAAVIPLSLFGTWFDHRMQGWWIGPRHVVSRTGWWVRTTQVVPREKLQSLELVQGPIARRWDLARLHLRVAGSRVSLPMIAFDEALELEFELSRSVVEGAARREQRAPLVDEDEHAPAEQQPGDRLGDEAHHHQRSEQDPASDPSAGGPREPGDDAEPADGERERGGEEHRLRQQPGAPVEPELPGEVRAHLEEHEHRVDADHRADDDVQRGDDGAPAGHADRPVDDRDSQR